MSVARIAAATAATTLVSLLAAAPAGAVPIDEGSETGDFGGVEEDFCGVDGLTVDVDGTFTARWRAHPQGPDGIAYYVSHSESVVTYTNVDTGTYVVETTRILEKDQEIVVDDDTLTITVLGTGPSKVKDAQGRVVAANPGQIRFQILVDHGGTPEDPFDDTFLANLGLVKESTGRTDNFCEKVAPALLS